MSGSKNVVECAFVENDSAHPSLTFFSSPVSTTITDITSFVVIHNDM
jgi:hypothetical protein